MACLPLWVVGICDEEVLGFRDEADVAHLHLNPALSRGHLRARQPVVGHGQAAALPLQAARSCAACSSTGCPDNAALARSKGSSTPNGAQPGRQAMHSAQSQTASQQGGTHLCKLGKPALQQGIGRPAARPRLCLIPARNGTGLQTLLSAICSPQDVCVCAGVLPTCDAQLPAGPPRVCWAGRWAAASSARRHPPPLPGGSSHHCTLRQL